MTTEEYFSFLSEEEIAILRSQVFGAVIYDSKGQTEHLYRAANPILARHAVQESQLSTIAEEAS